MKLKSDSEIIREINLINRRDYYKFSFSNLTNK